MERKLRYLEKEIKKDGIIMMDTGENPDAPQPREMIDLEVSHQWFYLQPCHALDNSNSDKLQFTQLIRRGSPIQSILIQN